MKISIVIKLFVIFTFSTVFICSVMYFGSDAVARLGGTNGTYGEGTKIGPHDVSDLTKRQASEILGNSVEQWEEETKITFQYKERRMKSIMIFSISIWRGH